MKARLFEKYKSEVVPALQAKHNFQNVHQIPKFVKIVVNMGVSASLEKGAIVEREGSIHLSNVMAAANYDARAAKHAPATAPATT